MEPTMKAAQFITGIIIGIAVCIICSFLFMTFATDYTYTEGLAVIRETGSLGKLITICSVLNIAVFFTLLKYNKIFMARGIIAATILLAIITIFV